MVGHENLADFARLARELLEPITEVRLGMQTNGVLLDEEFLRICDRWGIRIGVSIDGDQDGNDRHRRDRRGAGSYARVATGLAQLVKRSVDPCSRVCCARSTSRTTRSTPTTRC